MLGLPFKYSLLRRRASVKVHRISTFEDFVEFLVV